MPIFKKQRAFKVETDHISLPEAVRQLVRQSKLPTETKTQMTEALKKAGYNATEAKSLVAGQKKIQKEELKKLGEAMIKGKVQGMAKYASGATFVRRYLKDQTNKQARFYLYRQQREDEEKGRIAGRPDRMVSANDQRRGASSALAGKEGASSIFSDKPVSESAKTPRIKLPF